MTEDEARRQAIQKGALKPQGLLDRMAAGINASNGFKTGNWRPWATTPRAQDRLARWTQKILNGQEPKD